MAENDDDKKWDPNLAKFELQVDEFIDAVKLLRSDYYQAVADMRSAGAFSEELKVHLVQSCKVELRRILEEVIGDQ